MHALAYADAFVIKTRRIRLDAWNPEVKSSSQIKWFLLTGFCGNEVASRAIVMEISVGERFSGLVSKKEG